MSYINISFEFDEISLLIHRMCGKHEKDDIVIIKWHYPYIKSAVICTKWLHAVKD